MHEPDYTSCMGDSGTGALVQELPAVKWRVTASVLKGGPLGVQKDH